MPCRKWFPRTFDGAAEILKKRETIVVQNNTWLRRVDNDNIEVVLHHTAVVTYHRDGTQTIYHGGWTTPTTKDRITGYSAARVWSHKFKGDNWKSWAVFHSSDERTPSKITKCGSCGGCGKRRHRCAGADEYAYNGIYRAWLFETGGEAGPGRAADRYSFAPKGTGVRAGRAKACVHGSAVRHWHINPDHPCYRCGGVGTVDRGNQPIPTVFDGPLLIDATGKVLGPSNYACQGHRERTVHYKAAKLVSVGYDPPSQVPDTIDGYTVTSTLTAALPALDAMVSHPLIPNRMQRLSDVIVNLNDSYGWSRERVADWLETLDLDLSFPIPERI